MYSLVYKRGADCIISVPDGLKELMSDISREVLRAQPENINCFIAKYLSALVNTRDNCIMVTRLLAELCDCQFTMTERLLMLGFDDEQAAYSAGLIQNAIENVNPCADEKFKERDVLKTLLRVRNLSMDEACKVCKIMQEAYSEYWRKKKFMEHEEMMRIAKEPWQIAAQKTIELYAKIKPSMEEMQQAAVKIQKTYRGYYLRRCQNVLPCHEPPHEEPVSCSETSSDDEPICPCELDDDSNEKNNFAAYPVFVNKCMRSPFLGRDNEGVKKRLDDIPELDLSDTETMESIDFSEKTLIHQGDDNDFTKTEASDAISDTINLDFGSNSENNLSDDEDSSHNRRKNCTA